MGPARSPAPYLSLPLPERRSAPAAFDPPAGGSAYAQDGGPPPGGGQGPSPEMRALFQAARGACAADAKTLCDGKAGREMMMCLRENADKVSAPCKDAMSKLPPVVRSPRASGRRRAGIGSAVHSPNFQGARSSGACLPDSIRWDAGCPCSPAPQKQRPSC